MIYYENQRAEHEVRRGCAAFTMECSEQSERSFHVCVSSCIRSANEVGMKFSIKIVIVIKSLQIEQT